MNKIEFRQSPKVDSICPNSAHLLKPIVLEKNFLTSFDTWQYK